MNNEEKILSLLETLVVKVDKLEQNYTELAQGQVKLEQNYAGLAQGQMKLEQNYAKLEQGQMALKEELTDTRYHLILMENDFKQQLGGLNDGQKMLIDYAHETKEDISAIKRELEMHDLRIKAIDTKKKKSS